MDNEEPWFPSSATLIERIKRDETNDFSSRVMAIAGLMSGTAYAQFQYGMNYFSLTNWGQSGGDSDGNGPAFQPGGWNCYDRRSPLDFDRRSRPRC